MHVSIHLLKLDPHFTGTEHVLLYLDYHSHALFCFRIGQEQTKSSWSYSHIYTQKTVFLFQIIYISVLTLFSDIY